jgi:hypothetical protein
MDLGAAPRRLLKFIGADAEQMPSFLKEKRLHEGAAS